MDHAITHSSPAAHTVLFLGGGLCTGLGLLLSYWSFGYPGGAINQNLGAVGSSAIDNIAFLPNPGLFAVALLVVGIGSLVYANATTWRFTGGY